jgi:replication-associated recombination protein RarA
MKPALILYGIPGSGKTTWIKQEAKTRKYRLFRWNVRNDRSLREGREVLHAQVRSQEKTLIWIEGADDLTQEAQAFLRRILDTRSSDVTCILEVRDPSKLSAPVLSRCTLQRLPSEQSYRKTMLEGKALTLGIVPAAKDEQFPRTLEELLVYKQEGKDPNRFLWHLVRTKHNNAQGREALRRFASGSSAWLQVAWLLAEEVCG